MLSLSKGRPTNLVGSLPLPLLEATTYGSTHDSRRHGAIAVRSYKAGFSPAESTGYTVATEVSLLGHHAKLGLQATSRNWTPIVRVHSCQADAAENA